jgi:hypothetical protein
VRGGTEGDGEGAGEFLPSVGKVFTYGMILYSLTSKKEELAEPNFCKLPYDTAPKAD